MRSTNSTPLFEWESLMRHRSNTFESPSISANLGVEEMTHCLRNIATCLLFIMPHAMAHAQEDAPSNAVTFFAIVAPDTSETVVTATIGETQVSPEVLADAIRPGSGQVLRITSVHGSIFGAPRAPAIGGYALALVGACTPRSIRAFGNGFIAFGGLDTVRVAYRPGLVASLNSNELLCFRSLIQSNQSVMMEVHGYLMKQG